MLISVDTFTTQYIDTIHGSSSKDVRQASHLYDQSFSQLAKIIISFVFHICLFLSYHITWNARRALKTNKQTNKQINRIFRVRRKWNILKPNQCEVLCFLNLVTRWPAEPGGPLLPGRPGNPGTPSVPGGPCHIKTLWSVLENEIIDIHNKAQLTLTVTAVLWNRIEYKWKTFDTHDLSGQSSCVSIYCNWVKERWKVNKLWINLTSPYRFHTYIYIYILYIKLVSLWSRSVIFLFYYNICYNSW